MKSIPEKEGNIEEVAKMRSAALDDKISKYHLNPLTLRFFGGIIDFNRMGFLTRKGMEAAFKLPLQKHGFKETESGAYDLRDWARFVAGPRSLLEKSKNNSSSSFFGFWEVGIKFYPPTQPTKNAVSCSVDVSVL